MGDDLFMTEFETALIVLIAGLVIVFAVLFLLIGIIKGYGTIILSVTKSREAKRQAKKEKANAAAQAAQAAVKKETAPVPVQAAPAAVTEPVQDGIPGDVIAAIAAAVDFMYGAGTHIVTGVKRVAPNRSAWASAGMIESTRPF